MFPLVILGFLALSAFATLAKTAGGETPVLQDKGTPHAPIHIASNGDFTSANGVTGGSGTQSDPYIIEGWDIDAAGGPYGVWIHDTTAHFVVKNCSVLNATDASNPPYGGGISLRNVTHGILENNTLRNCRYGIYLELSEYNTVRYNDASNNTFGIYLMVASNNTIDQNTAVFCTQNPMYMRISHNNTVTSNDFSNNTYYSYGIYMDSANSNTISHNKVCGSIYGGMYITSSENNTISNNNLSDSKWGSSFGQTGVGIYLATGAVQNTIDGNEISGNERYGIYMQGAKWNKISNNTMFDNKKRGIYVDYYSDDNILANNTITGVPVPGPAPDHYGIYVYDTDNTTVTSNTIADYYYGIFIISASNNTKVKDNVLSGGNWSISLWTDNNTVASNTIVSGVTGIDVRSSFNTIAGNVISTTQYGIYGVGDPCDNTLYENTIKNANLTWSAGIYIENATRWNITGGGISECYVGIQMKNSNNCTVSLCTITNNTYYGMTLTNVRDTIIQSNQITKNRIGIYFNTVNNTQVNRNNIRYNVGGLSIDSSTAYSSNNVISSNLICNNSGVDPEGNPTGYGFTLTNTRGTTINDNTVDGNYRGILIYYGSENNTVTNNKITNGTLGVYLYSSIWNTLKYNNISYNSMYGVRVYASNNTITYNAFCNNTNYAIYIETGSANNTIHHNNFWGNNGAGKGATGNSQAADNAGGNKWYDAATNQGNYWSNWDGTGTYPIAGSAGATDSGPLSQPVPISETGTLPVFMVLFGLLGVLAIWRKRYPY
ncbi:MAG: right-handed parallel beta-helix repeat-containing protein [Thermoplasmata archaeon]|nr:right-handed parallel beta-helix repeat-containing protein [Thermoplasmata archaeon]